MATVEVIAPGTPVRIDGGVKGVVLAVTIRAIGVTGYEVAWWTGAARTTAWLEPHEVSPWDAPDEPLEIGFTGRGGG